MEYILNNEQLTVTFTTKGGTISSIEDSQGIEYLWQGDAAYWSGQAPVLFPICGGLRDDKALIGNNLETQMPRHGIVRKCEWEMIEKDEKRIIFEITSNIETKVMYPYDFRLLAKYTLEGRSLKITYEVENTDTKKFPFFTGGHPGFNCPLVLGEEYTDYEIVFEQKETCTVPTPVPETGLVDMKHRSVYLEDSDTVELNHEMFEIDAVIFDELKSRKLKLVSKKSGKGIEMEYKDFPYLILWSSANHGNFVAIEPWTGLSTCSDEGNQFEEKRNVQSVEAGESKKYSYSVSVL